MKQVTRSSEDSDRFDMNEVRLRYFQKQKLTCEGTMRSTLSAATSHGGNHFFACPIEHRIVESLFFPLSRTASRISDLEFLN